VAQTPRPLTILHVTAPAAVGGLERVVEGLAGGHARLGHVVHVVAVIGPSDPEPEMVRVLVDAGVQVHVLRISSRQSLAERAFVARLCRGLRPDVVHTHGFRSDVVDGGVARRFGIPTVTTVHGFTRNAGRGSIYEWLQRRSHARFDAVIAVSEAQTRELEAAGVPAGRLTVLRNAWAGSGSRLSREAAREALGVPEDRFHIGWVGRLSPEKGADLFLEAVARCSDPRLHASIIGDGRTRAALEAQARALGIADRVRFCGQLGEAARYFAGFDLFVMSSRTEGAPIVLFEAMAAEVPVVATAVGGIPEIAGGGEATLVAPADADALARAIDAAAADPTRMRAQTRAALQTLHAEYSAEKWLAAYESLYKRLGAQNRRTRETVH
ncbi:MAG TPA: glycosyltransferase, partial [Longimicrobiales bacterium]